MILATDADWENALTSLPDVDMIRWTPRRNAT